MPRVTITVTEKSPQPYRFDLKREIVTVGRGQDNDIVIGCGSVSGKHSEMHRVKGGYHLIDVGSTNGIKIDGIRHQTVVLHTGMTVKLGDVEFGFSLNEEELAVLASESEPTAKHSISKDDDFDEEENEDEDEVIEKKDIKKEEVSEKTHSKVDEKKHEEKYEEKKKDDDGPDKLPDMPVRLNKRKEKEDQEAEKKKKAEREERAARREKREKSESSEKKDEYSESKAVSIGSGFILFTLIAVAGAFFYGASTRHEKDTGDSLLKGIVNKEDAKTDAPKDVEDKPDGGAE